MTGWLPLGDRAIRFARPQGVSPAAILYEAKAWPGVIDVVIAREDVALYFASDAVAAAALLTDRIAALGERGPVRKQTPASEADDGHQVDATGEPNLDGGRDVELVATYGGPDLDDVARETGLTVAEVIRVHREAVYTVDTMGFLPGFAYLVGLDPRLVMSRRASPRTHVPKGALAIALDYTAVYPAETPGGWHLIGRVEEPMWSLEGARLRLGDRVRFVERP